jgi:hypothetical protein
MKRTVIGISLLLGGLYAVISIIRSAMLYLPDLNAWSTAYPSKLFFLILAGKSQFSDGADGLGLGLFFVFGIVLAILGLVILAKEYFSKNTAD